MSKIQSAAKVLPGLFCIVAGSLYSVSATWNNDNVGAWDTAANWTDTTGANNVPNSPGAVAAFVTKPVMSLQTISSNSNITIGTLISNVLPGDVVIGFPSTQTLTFDSGSTDPGLILVQGWELVSGTTTLFASSLVIDSLIVLNSNLEVFVAQNCFLTFGNATNFFGEAPISGPHSVTLNGVLTPALTSSIVTNPSSVVNFNLNLASNTYTGTTTINGGIVNLDARMLPGLTIIPANIVINQESILNHLSTTANNYAPTSVMTVAGGIVDFMTSTQTLDSILLSNQGAVFNSSSTISLLSGSTALRIGGNSSLSLNSLILRNGGAIQYDNTLPGQGLIENSLIDLYGNSNVSLIVDQNIGQVPGPGANPGIAQGPNSLFDLSFNNVSIINGSLNKTNAGIVLFEGTSAIPALTITLGTAKMGRSNADVISTTAMTTVTSSGALQGFGTLGTGGSAHVVNNGTLEPGDSSTIGTLTLSGSYNQSASGILFIKALSVGSADKLVVNSGPVSLNGALTVQTLPNSTFTAGQQIVVLDNTAGTGITGTFSSFQPILPSNLQATLQVNPNQVVVSFANTPGPCPPCPSCPSTPALPPPPSLTRYAPISSSVFALINGHALQLTNRLRAMRERMSKPQETMTRTAKMHLDKPRMRPSPMLASADPKQAFEIAFAAAQWDEDEEMEEFYEDDDELSIVEDIEEWDGEFDEDDFIAEESAPERYMPSPRFREKTSLQPFSVYFAPLGDIGEVDSHSKQPGYNFNSVGSLLGADFAFSQLGFGAQIGYEQLDAHAFTNWGKFEFQTVFASLYGTFLPLENRRFFIDVTIGGGGNWYDIDRNIDHKVAKAHPEGWQWDGFVGIGYNWRIKKLRITPLASVQYIDLHIDEYTEHGAGNQDSRVNRQNVHTTRSWLGVNLWTKCIGESATLLPSIRGLWQHAFSGQTQNINVASAAFNTTSQVQVFGGNRDYGVIGGEMRLLFAKYGSLAFSYDVYWNNEITTNFLYGELGVNF